MFRLRLSALCGTMDLPIEMIQHVFSFLSPCEIVKLRQVSRQFQEITRSSALWRVVYSNARLVLPPGPFPSQSTQYLERTLVQSELVSKTWTSQPVTLLRSTEISWERPALGEGCAIAFGRWCIFLDGKIIQCHDIDTETRHSLYDGTAHQTFSFTACTTAHTGDQWVHLLLVGHQPHELIRLLGFRLSDDGLLGPEIMDWTYVMPNLTGDWRLESCHNCRVSTPFLVVQHNHPRLVVDLRTRRLYKLLKPESFESYLASRLGVPISAVDALFNFYPHIVPTKTHIIVFWMHNYVIASHGGSLIQAFVVPDTATTCDRDVGIGELRLTHEVKFAHSPHRAFTLLRNSVLDPVTGSINIRVFHTIVGPSTGLSKFCLDLTLPKPGSTVVLPVSVRSWCLFHSVWLSEQYGVSDDGHARGFFIEYVPPVLGLRFRKFSIDANQEECAIIFSDSCPGDPSWKQGTFCGTRGRMHLFRQETNSGSQGTVTVRTIDLA